MGPQAFYPSSLPFPELPFPQVRLCGQASSRAWLPSPQQAGWNVLRVTPWCTGWTFSGMCIQEEKRWAKGPMKLELSSVDEPWGAHTLGELAVTSLVLVAGPA